MQAAKRNRVISFMMIVITIVMIASRRNKKMKELDVFVYPYNFKIYSDRTATEKYLKNNGITLEYEDSHRGTSNGLYFNYFGTSRDSLEYYVELYSLDGKLEGVKAVLYSNVLADTRFFNKIDEVITKKILPFELRDNILFDTLRENKASISVRDQYTIYVRTKKVDAILKDE